MTEVLRLYLEMEHHLLEDARPSDYFNEIYGIPLFQQHPFDMLHNLKKTMQSPKHHPEGNVWNHTMLASVYKGIHIKTTKNGLPTY